MVHSCKKIINRNNNLITEKDCRQVELNGILSNNYYREFLKIITNERKIKLECIPKK